MRDQQPVGCAALAKPIVENALPDYCCYWGLDALNCTDGCMAHTGYDEAVRGADRLRTRLQADWPGLVTQDAPSAECICFVEDRR